MTDILTVRPDIAEIKLVWSIVPVTEESILELRALNPKGAKEVRYPITKHFRATDYTDITSFQAAFEAKTLELNEQGYNTYIVMNPIRPAFMGNTSACDSDIMCRTSLLIDIDRSGSTDNPATQTEVDAAEALAHQVRSQMSDEGWPEPVVVMSGNGYHLYYKLDNLPNDDESADLVRETLAELARKFNNSTVSIDTIVFNASRITKIPGTVARKGQESEDRPFRIAKVCHDF